MHLLISKVAEIDTAWDAIGLRAARDVNTVTKETVAGCLFANNSCHDLAAVKTNANLNQEMNHTHTHTHTPE